MKVAVLGPRGTYTHQAAEEYFEDLDPVFCSSVSECLEHETAFIPFENSLQGGVTESIDLLRNKHKAITGEHSMPIHHVLASEGEIESVQEAVSHPQAIAQCRERINELGLDTQESASTAAAASNLDDHQAAICSKLAAELHDRDIIDEDIQDRQSNKTRFFCIDGPEAEKEKTSIFVEPKEDEPGVLASLLSCLSGHGLNLSYVQSRPTGEDMGNYFFYLEVEESQEAERFQRAIRCIETYASVKTAGSYS